MMNSGLPKNVNESIDYSGSTLRSIYLAGGCFWGVDAYMRRIRGVAGTTVGYANGRTANPAYEEVCRLNTGHAETVHVMYDPQIVPLEELLREYFSIIDPTSFNRQANDVGSQYRTGIYYEDPDDGQKIHDFVSHVAGQYDKKIVTEVKPLECYYLAEEYHQSYLEKNPGGYCHISF
ncbi:MAG: peptide-methionine (S)-S-oxide reductase MsrA [Saccharofermentanales bacterium]